MAFSFQKLFFRLSNKDKMLFARHLEVLIGSGMQLVPSLEILKRQTKSKVFITILDQLIMDVKNGHFLSVGLERYRDIFGDFFINLIRVGEASGTLSENLKYLGEELQKKQELQGKVRGALVYPIIILLATVGITSTLMFFIFPRVLPIFKSLNFPLPLITRVFIAGAEFMLSYGLWVFGGLVILLIIFALLYRLYKFRRFCDLVILATPFVGSLAQKINLISFSRTFGLLLKSGIKIVEALEIAGSTLSNIIYQEQFKIVAAEVRKGNPVSRYLITNPNLFPSIYSEMLLVGENTGKLDETTFFLADFYESELDEATKALSNVLEPMLLVFMGLIVGFVALAIITPIYKVTQVLGR